MVAYRAGDERFSALGAGVPMKWALVMMLAGTTPYDTGMNFDTINQCYVAEDLQSQTQALDNRIYEPNGL
jgi:hypothetical protein